MAAVREKLPPLPIAQSGFEAYIGYIERTRGNGYCCGWAQVKKNAWLCGQRQQSSQRDSYICYGVSENPNNVNSRRITIDDLRQLVRDLELKVEEPEIKLYRKAEYPIPLPQEKYQVLYDKLGIQDTKSTMSTGKTIVTCDSTLIPRIVPEPFPRIDTKNLIELIHFAKAIKSAAGSKKLPEYIDTLIHIGVYFESIAVYQSPGLHDWLSEKEEKCFLPIEEFRFFKLTQKDSHIINQIVSPVALDCKDQEAIPQLDKIKGLYTEKQIQQLFTIYHNEIEHYLKYHELKFEKDIYDFPLTFNLSARRHEIVIAPQIKRQNNNSDKPYEITWIMMDANNEPYYEVVFKDVARHILTRLTTGNRFVRHYPDLAFAFVYHEKMDEWLLRDAILEKEASPASRAIFEKTTTLFRTVTSIPIKIYGEIHTNAMHFVPMRDLINKCHTSKEFTDIHHVDEIKSQLVDEFTSLAIQHTPEAIKLIWGKINLVPQKRGEALANYLKRLPKNLQLEFLRMHYDNVNVFFNEQFESFKAILQDSKLADVMHFLLCNDNSDINDVVYAIQQGRHDIVRYLIEEIKLPSDIKYEGDCLVHIAVKANQPEIVKYLIEVVKLPIQINEHGDNLLHSAVRRYGYESKPADDTAQLEIVKYLAKKIRPDIPNKWKLDPFYIAVNSENLAVVKYLATEHKVDMHRIAYEHFDSAFTIAIALRNDDDPKNKEIANFVFLHDIQTRVATKNLDEFKQLLSDEKDALPSAMKVMVTNGKCLADVLNTLPFELWPLFLDHCNENIKTILNDESEKEIVRQNLRHSFDYLVEWNNTSGARVSFGR